MAKASQDAVRIGKFDILATYEYARALSHGHTEDEAKQRGMVAAVMGAQGRLGHRHGQVQDDDDHEDFANLKERAEAKKKSTIDASAFDRQVRRKLGEFFDRVFLPAMKSFVEAGIPYDEVKRLVAIPSTWGAKISGDQFADRVVENQGSKRPRNVRRRSR
jgi:hypothetical protein